MYLKQDITADLRDGDACGDRTVLHNNEDNFGSMWSVTIEERYRTGDASDCWVFVTDETTKFSKLESTTFDSLIKIDQWLKKESINYGDK